MFVDQTIIVVDEFFSGMGKCLYNVKKKMRNRYVRNYENKKMVPIDYTEKKQNNKIKTR